MMRLGYFEGFKGVNSVLVSLDPADISQVRLALKAAMTGARVALHDLADVSRRYPAHVFICRDEVATAAEEGHFLWVMGDEQRADADSMLEALEHCESGHQCFQLLPVGVELMISVGEYDGAWWRRAG